ncbi:MAG: hypothetical protein IJZ38_07370 [Bacteroides sp.]|nr:hypothetical protein [Bacteroides sp.]
MKTIDSTLSQLTSVTIVEDLRKALRENDRDFPLVEAAFLETMKGLETKIGMTAAKEWMAARDRQICSDLVYAGYLGFQANLVNFHNPVAGQFTKLDYETFLREHIMQTMPYRTEAEAAAAAILETSGEIPNGYEEAIRSYYVYLETTGPKLAHFWGYRFANRFLPWVEPGYVSDGAQTSMYALELHQDLGFNI